MVLADGTFDPIHVGHMRYLKAARGLCVEIEQFYVRIAPDKEITEKGRKPFQTATERAALVHAIIDCHCGYDTSLIDAIRSLKPRILVKGIDWHGRLSEPILAACRDVGAHIVYTQTQERTSTERLNA